MARYQRSRGGCSASKVRVQRAINGTRQMPSSQHRSKPKNKAVFSEEGLATSQDKRKYYVCCVSDCEEDPILHHLAEVTHGRLA